VTERVMTPGHLLAGPAEDHYVLRVVGDMAAEDGIQDGDLLVLLRAEARPGDVAAVLVGGDCYLRRYFPEGATVRLDALGRGRPAISVPAADIKVQGVVAGLMRKYRRGA